MRTFYISLLTAAALMIPAMAQKDASPFVGRWNFNIVTATSTHACWLGITQKNGGLEVWYQPPGGNVYQLKDVHVDGSHLKLTVAEAGGSRKATDWDLEAAGGQLTGVQTVGDHTTKLTGLPAPELKRDAPTAWTDPEPLFNGKDLTGWEPVGNVANNHWKADGVLLNTARGANLKTTRTFNDFKLHFEVNCPENGNSGFYLRGRYEVQIEYEALGENPPERRIGSIYGRIVPQPELPRAPGQWESFDITLVGRTVTEVHNGVTTIDHKEIEGITGGALDANEAEPGPFYIQGDHTGGLKFRNITISVPRT